MKRRYAFRGRRDADGSKGTRESESGPSGRRTGTSEELRNRFRTELYEKADEETGGLCEVQNKGAKTVKIDLAAQWSYRRAFSPSSMAASYTA